jgi:lipoprotein-releasing system ATP-binding protein
VIEIGFALQVKNVKKGFSSSDINFILNGIDFDIKSGESLAIVGKSGSGKSTLLQICGLLDEATEGSVSIDSSICSDISDDQKTLIRRHKIGFIYQFHHLLSEFNVLENLIIPQLICNIDSKSAESNAIEYLNKFHLKNKKDSYIHNLSGGEKQRIAIIRSIINRPKIIIADEPTGNLDNANAMVAFELLNEVLKYSNAGMIIATHSLEMANLCSKMMVLENGVLK